MSCRYVNGAAEPAGIRARMLAVLHARPELPAVLTPGQVGELADDLAQAAWPGDVALRAELAASTGSGWTGRKRPA